MIYPNEFESKIGFDSIRLYLNSLCTSSLGRDEVRSMSFSNVHGKVIHELECVRDMMSIITGGLPLPDASIHDILPYLTEIRAVGSYMSSERLNRLLGMLVMMSELARFLDSQKYSETGETKFPALDNEFKTMSLFPGIVSTIERVINKYGEVKDSASPELYEIRQSIRRASGSMQRAMRRVLDDAISKGLVDKDVTPSIRDGRLVIPVSAGNKRGINGIVHDESATGKTVFIEPADVVEAGNRLRELEMEERRAVIAVLVSVANEIRPYIDDISQSVKCLGKFDFIRAKAKFAIELDAQFPTIEDKPEIEWYHAVHPGLFLALKPQGREVVPLYLTLSEHKRVLIISGPNAGGKSVTLKTVAIVQYMMQCGLMPTVYYNSHMGLFDNLFIDIGDEQSFENDLSTYSSHLRNMKFFVTHANARTLLLADEMGSGTEPQIGGALAQAILQALGSKKCYGIVTTHYQNLKTFAETEDGFVNGAMLYDRQHLQPTYELSIGSAGSSFAIDIAKKTGLPDAIIERAKEIAGSDFVNMDKYLSEISRDRRYWANKRQSVREKEVKLDNLLSKYEETAGDLKSQRKEIINEARREAKEILESANAKIERTILEIRNAQAEKEKTKQLRQDLAEFKSNLLDSEGAGAKAPDVLKPLRHKSRKKEQKPSKPDVTTLAKTLSVGDYVKMEGSSTVGQILSIEGKKCEVAFGALRTQVNLSKLIRASAPKISALSAASGISASTSAASRERQLNFRNEIDLRGMRADEAIQAVTYFLDDAVQFSASRVRILHGTGHGILKTLIREQLNANPYVKHYADEDVRFGGAGITVVDLE